MKVALLKSHIDYHGGLEKATNTLATAFRQRGCELSLLTTSSTKGINVAKSSKIALYHHLKFDAGCRLYLKQHPHDIIFGMERNRTQTHYRAGSGVHAVYLERRKKLEGSLKFALNPLHYFLLKQEKQAFENHDLKCLFTNSYMVRKEILERFTIKPEKVRVVHNGVEWKALEAPFLERKRSKPFTFLFIGNGYKRKGLDYVLDVLPINCRLLVIGKEKNLPYYQKRAPSNVTFLGTLPNLTPYYQMADALLIPSIYDPFANVTVEALAMGLYVVSSKFNGGKEVLTEKSGCIIEDLFSKESVRASLEHAMNISIDPLTIRNSVKELEFSRQLTKIVEQTLC